MKFIIFLSFFILFTVNAFAYEVVKACAIYQNTGKSYKIEIQIYQGSELNERTNTLNYLSFAYYGVIFWSNSNATIIKFNNYFGSLSSFGNTGQDQRGYPWMVRKGHNFCI